MRVLCSKRKIQISDLSSYRCIHPQIIAYMSSAQMKSVKQPATEARRVSDKAMLLIGETDPELVLFELPLELAQVLVGTGVKPVTCTGFGSDDPVDEFNPLASCAKPTAGGLARKTEYTFFRKVSPTIQAGVLPIPISKIPPAHI
jgi:hypothetical protein